VSRRGGSGSLSPARASQSSFSYSSDYYPGFSQQSVQYSPRSPTPTRLPTLLPATMQSAEPSAPPATQPPRSLTCREDFCAQDPQTFAYTWELNKHKKIHTLPYKCAVEGCAFSENGDRGGFSQQRDLERHAATHQPLRSFRCYFPGCKSSATRDYNVVRHLRKQHGIEIQQRDVWVLCARS
jgi:hypothetical protein